MADVYFYDESGRVIQVREAVALIQNIARRTVAQTPLDFMGNSLLVSTVFVPVDHGPTHGTLTETPTCWLSAILGGPPDIDGTRRLATSREESLVNHEDLVDIAVAAGCTMG